MAAPPAYLFVIDTCVAEDEIEAAKSAVQQALQLLPEAALVGLITFGRHVQVHELAAADISRSYILQGRKTYTLAQIREHLGLTPRTAGGVPAGQSARGQGHNAPGSPFLCPLSECEFALTSILEGLTSDPWPTVAEHRRLRCSGNACQIANAVMEGSVAPGAGEARIMVLLGGPATSGSGAVVGTALEEPIRSHKDLKAGGKKAPYVKAATEFYDALR